MNLLPRRSPAGLVLNSLRSSGAATLNHHQKVSGRSSLISLASLGIVSLLSLTTPASAQHRYQQTNLVSDVAGMAAITDPNLVNPWGLSRSATSPWWTANNGTGTSTLYNGLGVKQALVVTVPGPTGSTEAGTPTGTVFNGSSDFKVGLPGTNQPARFLFATEEGTISGWNPAANATMAINKVDWSASGAVYKGLTLGQIGTANYLYAANFHAGTVDVFDGSFTPVNLGATAFKDPHLPKGYAPFNVQAIGDKIYVTYAKQDADKIDEVQGPGRGFVTAYTTSGVLSLRLHSGRWFNAPWGVAQAPADFGRLSGLILVGQFGSGKIAAFDPVTGKFRGLMRGEHHRSVQIDGLWALSFGNGAGAGPLNTLYFAAGINDEAHGLFGTLTSLPDPVKIDNDDDDHDGDDD